MQAPPLGVRVGLIILGSRFSALPRNPIILLEARLGLSPAPWERFTGMKTVFSGMSEAFHRIGAGDLAGAFRANFLALPFALSLVMAILFWHWPRLTQRRHEFYFFVAAIWASVAVTLVHGPT